jgi:hypothetical protein
MRYKKWGLRLLLLLAMAVALLLVAILNPAIFYNHTTTIANYTIYHHTTLDFHLTAIVQAADSVVKKCSLYSANQKIAICLNDGSYYTKLLLAIRGPAFGWGFANKVVLLGQADWKANTVSLNGYKWNATALLAHEITHCMQYLRLGLWKSNPVAHYPDWKWEGFAEYIARNEIDANQLQKNISMHASQHQLTPNAWAIQLSDSTIVPKNYYEAHLLVSYCRIVRNFNFEQLLKDTTSATVLLQEMQQWHQSRHQ